MSRGADAAADVVVRRPASSADGWRGRIDREFTRESARRIVRAILDTVPASPILVAYDGRRLSEAVGRDAAQEVAAAGRAPTLVRHLPTPTASFLTGTDYAAAILVTASHNPPHDNGVKLKVAPGLSAPPALVARIDARIAEQDGLAPLAPLRDDSIPAQAAQGFCARHVAHLIRRRGRAARSSLRVVVDGLGGIAEAPMLQLGAALEWRATGCGGPPTPDFGGLVPDPVKPQARARAEAAVRREGADIGLVLDGDGDRLYVIDETGATVEPHDLMALVLDRLNADGGTPGAIGVTQSAGMAIRLAAARAGVDVHETPIGFKHLAPRLARGEIGLAVGAVGDFAVAGWSTDRDPFALATLLTDLLDASSEPLSIAIARMRSALGTAHLGWIECRIEGPVPDAEAAAALLARLSARTGIGPVEIAALDRGAVRARGRNHQWLMLRASTTEPGVRLYGELDRDGGRTPTDIAALAATYLDPSSS